MSNPPPTPSSYVDAKRYFLTREPYSSPLNLLFTRYSSPYRIATTTGIGTLGGGLFGIAWAIYHGQSKARFGLRCGAGSLVFSMFYAGLNEILNGVVKRKLNKEQFFLSNTGAGIMTWGMVHLFQRNIQRLEPRHSMMRSFKYVWTLVVVALYNEISIIHHRDQYLGRMQNTMPDWKFELTEQPNQELKTSRPLLEESPEKKTDATPVATGTLPVKAEK